MATFTGAIKGSGAMAPVVQGQAVEQADTMQALFREKVWKERVAVQQGQ